MRTLASIATLCLAGCITSQPADPPDDPSLELMMLQAVVLDHRLPTATDAGHIRLEGTTKAALVDNPAGPHSGPPPKAGPGQLYDVVFSQDVRDGRIDPLGLKAMGGDIEQLRKVAPDRPQEVGVGDTVVLLVPARKGESPMKDDRGRLVAVGVRVLSKKQK